MQFKYLSSFASLQRFVPGIIIEGMEPKGSTSEIHCFICTNCVQEVPENNGLGTDGNELWESVKFKIGKIYFNKIVRVNRSSCLDKCSKGINAIIYPQTQWLSNLKSTDADKLIEILKGLDKE